MRARFLAGAIGLGCAGLAVLIPVTPADATKAGAPDRSAGDLTGACEAAAMDTGGGGPGLEITTDVPDGAVVAPGQKIRVRLTWDPKAWAGKDLDRALVCVSVQGIVDPDLSAAERPTANDGMFEYRLRVPEDIKPDCDICIEGFLAGITADDCCPQQVGTDRRCFMSGPKPPPKPPAKPPAPPAAPPPAPAAPPPAPVVAVPPAPPPDVPAQVAGVQANRPAPAPEPVSGSATELPRTGAALAQVAAAGAGLSLTLGGLAVIGGAGRRPRRRTGA